MNIFGKKSDTTSATTTPEQVEEATTIPPTPQPQPMRSYKLMNTTQLQRTKETKRLAETKLQNLEDSMKQLQKQQEWLRRHNELNLALKQEKARLFELNKQLSSMSEDIRQLERYEAFESIAGNFQRLTILERQTADNKRNISQMEHEAEVLQSQWDEQEKRQHQAMDQRKAAGENLLTMHENIFAGLEINGANEVLEKESGFLRNLLAQKRIDMEDAEKNIAMQEEEIDLLTQELERHRAGRQSMEMHEQMLEHGEAILLRLEYLQEVETAQKNLRNRQKEATRRQNEENEQLGRVFSQYQDINSQIGSLEDELQTHRASIQGQDSYKLQERAMSLKSRTQMLLSAQSLWKRIATGYALIETKQGTLTELNLSISHTEDNIRQLEAETGKTTRLCREKEYTYLLSKGQNVIQLRADLKEGVSCSVCGATHHPYHSDTMLDQSKLIGEFKTDYELLAQEARSKQQLLEDMKMELAERKGKQIVEESTLHTLRQRQAEDVKEWRIFASLDRQFQDCSESTNAEARTAMLRQLIENNTRDAEMAQKELDAFNFHQSLISELSEKLLVLEQKKNDLSTRLNELNTGCQVMAGQVDRLQAMIEAENTRYSQTYEVLDKTISIKDWLGEWNQNHEGLRNHIQQLMTTWQTVNERIAKEQKDLMQEKLKLESMKEQLATQKATMEAIGEHAEKLENQLKENLKEYERELGERDPKDVFQENYKMFVDAFKNEEKEKDASADLSKRRDRVLGRNDLYIMTGEILAADMVKERSALDVWMHAYNAQNPPVQYQELEDVFNAEKDWNAKRQKIRPLQQEATLCQAKVDDLNSRFIALQAESGYRHINEEELQDSLATQHETLYSRRNEIMMQIARMTVALEEHEKALHQAHSDEL